MATSIPLPAGLPLDGAQAKAVAEAIAQEAFHNVAYFGGTFETLIQQVAGK